MLTNDGNAIIQKYTGSSSKLRLPIEIDGHAITTIAERAFINNQKLKKVTIPVNIANIEDAAFAACQRLTEILVDPFNEHFTSVDGVLFNKDETALIQCPAGKKDLYFVPVWTETIGNYAFLFCQKLTHIYIPDGITHIGNNAFESTLIQNIELPKGIQELRAYLFLSCNNLQPIRIPEKCKPVINYESIAEGGRAV